MFPRFQLKPQNRKHEEIIVPAEEVKVQGRVVWSFHYPRESEQEMDALNSILGSDNEGEDMPQDKGSPRDDDQQRLNLVPPEGGYELYRHKDAEGMKTKGWHGYYWARPNEAGDYEIRSVPSEEGEPSALGGIFPKSGFEEHYKKVRP